MTHLEILGLKPGATKKEIKVAYRKRAKQLHPDKQGDKDAFESLKGAYEALAGEVSGLTIDRAVERFNEALRTTRDPSADLITIAISSVEKQIFRIFDSIVSLRSDIELTEIVLSRLTGEKSIPDSLREDIQAFETEINQSKREIQAWQEVISYLGRFSYRSDYEENTNGPSERREGKRLIP
jgi:FtsZ-binding cell division protein ZapB